MAKIRNFPFNSRVVEISPEGTPVYDFEYDAGDFADDRRCFWGNGVFPNPSDNLKVTSVYGNLTLSIRPGRAFIEGHTFVLYDGNYDLTLEPASTTYARKDIVVLRLDNTERLQELVIKKGSPAASPKAPELQRDDDVYELKLAEITIPKGVSVVTSEHILDTRLNSNVCGIVRNTIESIDTTNIYNQYETFLTRKIAEWESEQQHQTTAWTEQTNQQASEWYSKMSEREQAWNNLENSWENEYAAQVEKWETEQEREINEWNAAFNIAQNTFNGWFGSVKNDISLLQTFDFDNLAALSEVRRTTTFTPGTPDMPEQVTATIVNRLTGIRIAEKTTVFMDNGNISATITLYAPDGVKVVRQAVTYTEFNPDGSVDEICTGFDDYNGLSPGTGGGSGGSGGIGIIVSETEPIEENMLWLKPMGSINISDATDEKMQVQPLNVINAHIGMEPPDDTSKLWYKPIDLQ